MGCERPGGLLLDIVRDSGIKFPLAWRGDLPRAQTREEVEAKFSDVFKQKQMSASQIKEALDYLVTYEERYYEHIEGGGQCYHRPCCGGSVVQGETGIFCSKCGKLPDLLPPVSLR